MVRINGRGISRTLPTDHCEVIVPDADRCTRNFQIGVASLHGTFTDAVTGLPVPEVELQTDHGITIHKSEESGAYRFIDLPPGRQLFRVRKKGYADMVIVTEVTGAAEGVKRDLEMQPEVRVVVRVVGRDGRPFTGVISAIWGLKIGPSASLSTGARLTTDVNGYATIPRLGPGETRLWFKTEGFGSARLPVTLRRGDNRVEVRLE